MLQFFFIIFQSILIFSSLLHFLDIQKVPPKNMITEDNLTQLILYSKLTLVFMIKILLWWITKEMNTINGTCISLCICFSNESSNFKMYSKKIISAENYIGQSSECRMHLLKLYAYTMNTNNAKRSLKLVIHL